MLLLRDFSLRNDLDGSGLRIEANDGWRPFLAETADDLTGDAFCVTKYLDTAIRLDPEQVSALYDGGKTVSVLWPHLAAVFNGTLGQATDHALRINPARSLPWQPVNRPEERVPAGDARSAPMLSFQLVTCHDSPDRQTFGLVLAMLSATRTGRILCVSCVTPRIECDETGPVEELGFPPVAVFRGEHGGRVEMMRAVLNAVIVEG